MHTTHLLLAMGYPGSGKTHFAEQFCAAYPVAHLNSDAMRFSMEPEPMYNRQEHRHVFGGLDYAARLLLSNGVSIFYDANTNQHAYRGPKYELAQQLGVRCTLLWFQTPLDQAVLRTQNRKERHNGDPHFINMKPETVREMADALEPPGPDEPVFIINGTAPYDQQATRLAQHLGLTARAPS